MLDGAEAPQPAADAGAPPAAASPRRSEGHGLGHALAQVGHAIEHTAEAAAHGVAHAGHAAAHGVAHAGHVLEHTAEVAAHGVSHAAHEASASVKHLGQVAAQAAAARLAAAKLRRLGPQKGKIFQGGFPGAPMNASICYALAKPDRSNCYELCRDACLRFFVRHQSFFMRLAVFLAVVFLVDILVIIVFFWGAIFGIGIFHPNAACVYNASDPTFVEDGNNQYPPTRLVHPHTGEPHVDGVEAYTAEFCNLNHQVFNVCIKVILLILSYINLLPLPWRIAIFVDAWGDAWRKEIEPPGLDFYDRPTEAIWFHIPRHRRAVIACLLTLASVSHIVGCGFAIHPYWAYIETQTWPGAMAANFPGLVSIISMIAAGVLQGKAEGKLIREQPLRFPPAPTKWLFEAWREWRSGKSGKPLLATLKSKMAEFKALQQERMDGTEEYNLTGIHVKPDDSQLLRHDSRGGAKARREEVKRAGLVAERKMGKSSAKVAPGVPGEE